MQVRDEDVNSVLVVDYSHVHAVIVETVRDRQRVIPFTDEIREQRRVHSVEVADDLSHGHSPLHNALIEHRCCNFPETRDVRADDVVVGPFELFGRVTACPVNPAHDVKQLGVNLLAAP